MRRLDAEQRNVDENELDVSTETEGDGGSLTEYAGDVLEGILAAAENLMEETQEITIARNGRKYFKLVIRPISDEKSRKLRKQCTNYKKNKKLGVLVPDEINQSNYHSMLIYEATVNKDETWDNKALWKALESTYPIVTGWQTVDCVLLAGEKEMLLDAINDISGYENEEALEETVKNSSGPEAGRS